MVMLARFVPWRARDVEFEVEAPSWGPPIDRTALGLWSVVGGAVALLAGLGGIALVAGLTGLRAGRGFSAASAVAAAFRPASVADWTTSFGLVVLAVLGGLATAATLVARRGLRSE
jgi:hypothetical protein